MNTRFFGKLTFWKGILLVLVAAGLYATFIRFSQGLGAATNLSDEFPWGLWIGFDIMVGVGLAAGGFVIAATVHVFGLEAYKPIARPTILTAFLGYVLVTVALLYDVGRPYRIWHPLVMGNPHSVMFEVAWCVMLYTTVLALEFSPLVFERLGWHVPLKWVRAIYVPLVIIGVLLSTMHQSSLGTLYVIAPEKLHGLWYTPLLPVFFFISAIAGGLAMTIFESFMSFRAFGKRLETPLLSGLARVIVVTLAVYLVWRIFDLAGRHQLGEVFRITPESVLFWGEIGLGVILPMLLLAIPRVRTNEQGLFFASVLTIFGFIINRLNVAITGMAASSGVHYLPSWMEMAVTIMIVAIGFALFALAVKHLPIFPREEDPAPAGTWRPGVHGGVVIIFWVLLILGAQAVAYALRHDPASEDPAGVEMEAPLVTVQLEDLDLPEVYTFTPSDPEVAPVRFSHRDHLDSDAVHCETCHQTMFSLLEPGTLLFGEPSEERFHEGDDLCGSCHNGDDAFDARDDENCEYCHE